jgi:hypothetical protein
MITLEPHLNCTAAEPGLPLDDFDGREGIGSENAREGFAPTVSVRHVTPVLLLQLPSSCVSGWTSCEMIRPRTRFLLSPSGHFRKINDPNTHLIFLNIFTEMTDRSGDNPLENGWCERAG